MRYRRQPSDEISVEVGSGYMYEHERLDVAPGGPDEREQETSRWVSFLITGFDLVDGKLSIVNSLFVMPSFDDFDDYRLLDEVEVMVGVTQRVALGLSLRLEHDSRPPSTVEETDVALAGRLRWRF